MATIPSNLRPSTYTGGAITQAQQGQVDQYGSLQAASQAQYQEASSQYQQQAAQQQAAVANRIQELQNIIKGNTLTGSLSNYSKKTRREAQAARTGSSAELDQLLQLQKSIQPGTVYQNVPEILSQTQQYGQQVETYAYDKSMSQAQKNVIKQQLAKSYEDQQTVSTVAPTILSPTPTPSKTTGIKPGQALYYELDAVNQKGEPVISTIYTSPDKSGAIKVPGGTTYSTISKTTSKEPTIGLYTPLEQVTARYTPEGVQKKSPVYVREGEQFTIAGSMQISPQKGNVYRQPTQSDQPTNYLFGLGPSPLKVAEASQVLLTQKSQQVVDRYGEPLVEAGITSLGFGLAIASRPVVGAAKAGQIINAGISSQLPKEPSTEEANVITFFRGGQEVTMSTDLNRQPWPIGIGGGTDIYSPNTISGPITPDQKVGLTRAVEEYALGKGGQYITLRDEQIYIRNANDLENLQALLNDRSVGTAKKLRVFIREQQAKLKSDLSRFEQLSDKMVSSYDITPEQEKTLRAQQKNLQLNVDAIKSLNLKQGKRGLTAAEEREYFNLEQKINSGQLGTLSNLTYQSTEAQGTVGAKVLGLGLVAGTAYYGSLKGILGYQIGGAVIGAGLGLVPGGASILGGITAVTKPLQTKKAVGVSLALVGGATGFGEYQRNQDIGYAIAAGFGGATGFLSGVYSKQIVEGIGKVSYKTLKEIDSIIQKGGPSYGKKGSTVPSMYDQEEAYTYDKVVRDYAKKKGISLEQARAELEHVYFNQFESKLIKARNDLDEEKGLKALRSMFKRISNTKNPIDRENAFREALKIIKSTWPELLGTPGNGASTISGGSTTTGPTSVFGGESIYTGNRNYESTAATFGELYGPRITGGDVLGGFGQVDVGSVGRIGPKQTGTSIGRLPWESGSDLISGSGVASGIGVGVGSFFGTSQDRYIVTRLKKQQRQGTTTIQNTDQGSDSGQGSGTKQGSGSGQGFGSGQPQIPTVGQPQIPTIGQPTPRTPGPSTPSNPPTQYTNPPLYTIGFPGITGIEWPGDTRQQQREQPGIGYQGYVLNKKRYVKVTNGPQTKEAAMDAIARVIDNTTSAQGRVEPITRKVKKGNKVIEVLEQFGDRQLQQGDGYLERNQQKFRGFKMFQGQKVSQSNTLIEKKRYRSDTPGEKTGLTFGQFSARSRKRAVGLPVRRNKGRRTPFGF